MITKFVFSFEERSKALETITQTLQESMTFEDFCVQVCCPGQTLQGAGGSSASISGNYFSTIYRFYKFENVILTSL